MGLDGIVWGGFCWDKITRKRLEDERSLENYGYKVYSQSDEDGIIQEIFKRIGVTNKEFIEFGVQDGLECNSHYLLHQGWKGLWIEGDRKYCNSISHKFRPALKKNRLRVCNAFITRDNINTLIRENAFSSQTPDFLSIDIDGNDWYVWKAIDVIEPRVVCIEYNGKFPPDFEWKQAYDKKHVWDGSDWQGASLKSLEILGREKGYTLVCTNLNGVNAFFVKTSLTEDKFPSAGKAEALYNPMRSYGLRFLTPGHPAKYFLGYQEENKGVLNYYDDLCAYRKQLRKEHKKLKAFITNTIRFIKG